MKVQSETINITEFIKIIKNRKFLIILIFFLVVSTTVIVTALMDKWYLAVSTIRVEKPSSDVSVWENQRSNYFDPYFIKEQESIIKSKKILNQVINNLNLNEVLGEIFNAQITKEQTYELLVHTILNIESKSSTSLIDIGVLVKEDGIVAAQIANEIAKVYEADRINFATASQVEGIKKLNEELNKQVEIVSNQRDEVEKIRQELQISGVDIDFATTELEIDLLRQLDRNLTALKVDAIARKTRWERFNAVPLKDRITLVNSELIPDANLQNLMQAYLIAEQQYSRLKGRLGTAHPEFIEAKEHLKTIKSQLYSLLTGYEKSLEISYREADARVKEMEKQVDVAKLDQIELASHKMRLFEDAVEKLRDEETLHKAFRMALRQREIDYQVPKRSIEILNFADTPYVAKKPSWILNITLGIFFGCVLSFGFTFLIEFIDTSFRSIKDIESKLQLPILGVIPKDKTLVCHENFVTNHAEPFRVIQTNLELVHDEKPARIISIQSAGPSEGKSTTLHNLAITMALSGQKVIVIDSDLRKPTQHKLFDTKRDPGLIDYLLGKTDSNSIINKTNFENLDFIACGKHSNFSLNILHRKQLTNLFESLRSKYDKILLDSTPIIGISDSSVLASISDGIIFVVQHRRNSQSMIIHAHQIIKNVEGQILGIVLTNVPEAGDEDYNYYTNNYKYYSTENNKASSVRNKTNQNNISDIEELEYEESEI